MTEAAVTAITSGVDFGTIVVGIGAIFSALGVVNVAMAGGRRLMSAIR